MESEHISLGDIVALKAHPYFTNITEVLISGDPLQVSPLMIVVEIAEFQKKDEKADLEYTCIWFSNKANKFERSRIKGLFLKLVVKSEILPPESIKPGDVVSLATIDLELAKKKSSLYFEDTFSNQGIGISTINALLTFLPPLLHCIDVKVAKEKITTQKKNAPKHNYTRSKYSIKCMWFNNTLERFSEEVIPIEALKIASIVNTEIVSTIRKCIDINKILTLVKNGIAQLIKPRSIVSRSGYYFLRGYDYVENRIVEINIEATEIIKVSDTPYVSTAPKFDISKDRKAASPAFILKEFIEIIREAKKAKAYIRIKYKNRNDQLTTRSLRNYEIVEGEEDGVGYFYLTGFCMLRQSLRTFKISRIQNFQQLSMSYE